MPMDEVIRAIECMEAEDMQDVLNAVAMRYQELFPAYSLLLLSLPRDDPAECKRVLTAAWDLMRSTEN